MFPNISLGSIGWRMGAGGEYWIALDKWFTRMDQETQVRYVVENPEPVGWNTFFIGKSVRY